MLYLCVLHFGTDFVLITPVQFFGKMLRLPLAT